MARDYLIAVDMQNDFVTGSLGTGEAERIVPAVLRKVEQFRGRVCFTQDTHDSGYLSTQEGRQLPVEHCIRGTRGWELIDGLREWQRSHHAPVIQKGTFGSVELAEMLRQEDQKYGIRSVELIGLCTDICVISNALLIKAFLPEVPVLADAFCCAGVTPEGHIAALRTMTACQIIVENSGI